MADYTKTTWVDDSTPLSAANFNNMETGIYNNTNKNAGFWGYSKEVVVAHNTITPFNLYAININGNISVSDYWKNGSEVKGVVIPAGCVSVTASITLQLPTEFDGILVNIGIRKLWVYNGTEPVVAAQSIYSEGNGEYICATYSGYCLPGDKISAWVAQYSGFSKTIAGNRGVFSVTYN